MAKNLHRLSYITSCCGVSSVTSEFCEFPYHKNSLDFLATMTKKEMKIGHQLSTVDYVVL